MSGGTRRQDHDRADAYAYVRSGVNYKLGTYARRLKAAAEAYVDEKFQEASAGGMLHTFDPEVVGREALAYAEAMYLSQEQIEAPAEEIEE